MELIRMRKSFALLLLICGVTLASCGGPKQDLESLRRIDVDLIDTDIKNSLHLDFTDDGKKLYTEARDTDSYYDIYISNDYKNSLFMHEIGFRNDSDELIINERTKELFVNTLSFKVDTYQDEAASIMSEVYNDKYGIPSLTFDFEISKDNGYQKQVYSLDDKFLYPLAKENKDLKLQVAYMPIYAVRTYKNKTIYKNYFFIPLQYQFVLGDKAVKVNHEKENDYELVDKIFTDIDSAPLLFDANNPTVILHTKPQEENK